MLAVVQNKSPQENITMPVYMEISRLHRTVTIVARGTISPEEIRSTSQQLADAKVRPFAKLVEVAGATTEWTPEQLARMAQLFRGASSEQRGPIAFIIDPAHTTFPQAYADLTKGDGPIDLFTSLGDARAWLRSVEHAREHPELAAAQAALPPHETPWTDPERQAVMIRGERRRDVRVRGAA
jgi:hypothetical protein